MLFQSANHFLILMFLFSFLYLFFNFFMKYQLKPFSIIYSIHDDIGHLKTDNTILKIFYLFSLFF